MNVMVFRFKEQVYAKELLQWDLNLHHVSSTESDTVIKTGERSRGRVTSLALHQSEAEVKGLSGGRTRRGL
ncbi:hypothetical protein J4Q44_G00332710 [Coregonus suidteri]|uniref:Uncharacterized protein n=1 Tax=Coregonus suidteri TaxID=861788 RepID=A0AAN8KQC7_9TELE